MPMATHASDIPPCWLVKNFHTTPVLNPSTYIHITKGSNSGRCRERIVKKKVVNNWRELVVMMVVVVAELCAMPYGILIYSLFFRKRIPHAPSKRHASGA